MLIWAKKPFFNQNSSKCSNFKKLKNYESIHCWQLYDQQQKHLTLQSNTECRYRSILKCLQNDLGYRVTQGSEYTWCIACQWTVSQAKDRKRSQ